MKKILLSLLASGVVVCAFALPKAVYVKKGDKFDKYNFGVAEDLMFSNNGHTLTIKGYNEVINLDEIDYITFSAPVDHTAMTPSAQKEKLIEIGEAVNSMIDVNDYAPVIKMQDDFFQGYYDSDDEWVTPPVEFNVPEELYDVHRSAKSLIKALGGMAHGNIASVRGFKSEAVDLYSFADYKGIYSANYDTETWEKIGESDNFEVRFRAKDSETYSVKVVASPEYTYWDRDLEFAIEVPKVLTFTFAKGKTQLASAVVKSEFIDGQKLSVNVEADALGLNVKNDFNVVDNLITDVVEIKVDGKHLVKSVSKIDGKNLVTYDVLRNDVENSSHHHDEEGNCIDGDPYPLIAHFIRGNADVDLIGQLQLKGKTFGFNKLYDSLKVDDEADFLEIDGRWVNGSTIYSHNSDYSKIYIAWQDFGVMEDHVNHLNNYTDVSFGYDGNDKTEGFLSWENMIEGDGYSQNFSSPDDNTSYWRANVDGIILSVNRDFDFEKQEYSAWYYEAYNKTDDGDIDWSNRIKVTVDDSVLLKNCALEYVDGEVTPVLLFPDLTTFSFEEYFDSVSFRKLIDDYDAIIDTYDKITGQNR